MKIKANGIMIKYHTITNMSCLIIGILGTITCLVNFKEMFLFSFFYAFILMYSYKELKISRNCYICFNENSFEYHFIRTKPGRYSFANSKKGSYILKYSDVKEYGNIKYLSKKFSNNRVYNIGFITKDNRKHYIFTNEYKLKELELIVETLQKRIKIKPVKEITLDKNTYKSLYY